VAAVIEQLSSQGHTVETANNGLEGLDKFLSGQFDLVVTDRAMPEMGGDQLATAIKQVAPDRPIIMLTGFGDLMEAARGGCRRRQARHLRRAAGRDPASRRARLTPASLRRAFEEVLARTSA
jgi:CheY-like chemotaxis protein